MRQAQDDVAGAVSAFFRNGLDDILQFTVIQEWNHWRRQNANWDPRLRQRPYQLNPRMRRPGTRFEDPAEFRIQRRDGDDHFCEAIPGHVLQDVHIPLKQGGFCDDRDRMAEFLQNFEDGPGDLELTLDRLVSIRVVAETIVPHR